MVAGRAGTGGHNSFLPLCYISQRHGSAGHAPRSTPPSATAGRKLRGHCDRKHSMPEGMNVETLGSAFDEGADGFRDSAAVMACCDLVITTDTAIAHLAGATGTPVWLALQYVSEWRWFLGRADSPWYRSMRLFRQASQGDWPSVFEEIRSELVTYVDCKL
jgi:hypothetical protein